MGFGSNNFRTKPPTLFLYMSRQSLDSAYLPSFQSKNKRIDYNYLTNFLNLAVTFTCKPE